MTTSVRLPRKPKKPRSAPAIACYVRDLRALAAALGRFPALRVVRLECAGLTDEQRAELATPSRRVTGTLRPEPYRPFRRIVPVTTDQ